MYIVAEVGPNHNGDFDLAVEYIKQLSRIGVDAVKFQLNIPEALHSNQSFKVSYQKKNDSTKSPLEMGRKFQFSYKQHEGLFRKCKKQRIQYLCTAYDFQSLQFLHETLNIPIFKIASGEIFSLDMIDYIAKIDKPILLSTGMTTSFEEIGLAIDLLNRKFVKDITVLHCISNYPTPYTDVNLNVILELKKRFNLKVGFSDHTIGNECAIAAVAMGAVAIEKHVTLDKTMEGPDHKASATINEFKHLVRAIHNIELALGVRDKICSLEELEIRSAVRKSIVSARAIHKGEVITREDICFKRPGTGFLPIEADLVLGKKASTNIEKNNVILKKDLIWG